MMMLTELTSVPGAALPVQVLRDHLRLGTGFADDGMQDGLLESCLRAAMAAIEARTGKVLLTRTFRLALDRWRDATAQALPVAPVSVVNSVTLFDAGEAAVPVAPARWKLIVDTHRPRLASVGTLLPTVPEDGRVEVVFEAGFGAIWTAVPVDLAQAVLLLAGQFYETRHEPGGQAEALPRGVQLLVERWRNVRVLGGGAA
jgi:uncharacterized phiE125 gp8 family phage protein